MRVKVSVTMMFAVALAGGTFGGSMADKIAVWGYVLDKTPTACPFMIGKTEFSLERAAAEFGAGQAMYMNSLFNRDYILKYFSHWDRECFENCIDNRMTDGQLDKLRDVPEVWCATTHGKKLESAVRIAELSLRHPNIVGVNFDDFGIGASAKEVTLEKVRAIKAAMHAVNPKLKVSVVSYAKDSANYNFDLSPYRGEIDHVSRWKWVTDTNYWHNYRADIAELRRQVGPGVKIVQGLYFHDFTAPGMKGTAPLPLDYLKLSVSTALDAVADGTIDGVILPQVAWYSVPSHREHYEWLRAKVRDFVSGRQELAPEKELAFRRRLETVHEPGLRDATLKAKPDEFAFRDGSEIAYAGEPSPYMRRAIADFADFMDVSMGLRIENVKCKMENVKCKADVRISVGQVAKGYEVEVGADGVSIRAKDDRQAAQALYHLEDLMGLRRAPFLKLGTEKRSPRFSPRMAHSGWGCDQYPDAYLMKLQHTGIDTIILFIERPGVASCNTHTLEGLRLDAAGFIRRMHDFGFDVYVYSQATGFKHPSDPDAPQFFDELYGGISKSCPGAKGYILVDEKCHFPSKDPRVCQWDPKTRRKVDPKDPRPWPSYFPGYDYLDWVDIVRQSILRYSPQAEVVFWTYAFVWAPPEPCREFIRKLPKEIPVMATFVSGLEHRKRNGLESRVEDYSIAVAGPGDFFRRQAGEAAANGHKVYTMANSAGLAWDFGTIPYNPCPYQWRRRWQAVNDAQRTWNVQGVMECHHYGVWPSFITELEKEAFTEGGMDFDGHIRLIAARDFGEENMEKVLAAWKGWSDAIADMSPRGENQYGPFRMGPAYLFNAFQPELKAEDWFGGKFPKHVSPYARGGGKGRDSNYLKKEIELFEGMVSRYFAGAAAFREIAAAAKCLRRREKALRMAYLGEYMGRAVMTAKHVREGTLAERAKDREKAHELAKLEYENTKAAIDLMKRDSRLGWEPTMKYQGGVEACEWKLRRLERLYGIAPDAINSNMKGK